MGGTGSGRYGAGYEKGKRTVESMQSVHISAFTKYLKENEEVNLSVNAKDGKRKLGEVTIDPFQSCIFLEYGSISDEVHYDTTPCNFGGVRYWFVCPHCDKRAGKLFGGRRGLACRKCYDLNYFSQQHTKTDCYYYSWKAEQIARKIDKDYEYSGTRPIFPPKPKYMKWSVYQKLRNQFYDYSDKSYQVWLRGVSYILGGRY
jgi:hypothetical protein